MFEVIGVVEDVIHVNAYADIWAPLYTFPSGDLARRADRLLCRPAAGQTAVRPAAHPARSRTHRQDLRGRGSAYLCDSTTFWADSKLDLVARELLGNKEQVDSGGSTLLLADRAAMLLFMLLPALNLVNLNTGRILERSSEIGVRKAFGATSMQLAGQLVVENVLLCLAGGLIGLAFTRLVLWWLETAQLIPYLKVGSTRPCSPAACCWPSCSACCPA
jgi:putative ABC transport system permease protein